MNKDSEDSEPYEVYASDIHKNDDNYNNKFRDTTTTTTTTNMDNIERHTVDSRYTMTNKNQVSNIGQSKPTISSVTLASVYEDSLVEIPEHFIKFACIAFSCNNWETPYCWGCKESYSCICIEGDHLCLKRLTNNSKACCLIYASQDELISCNNDTPKTIRCYQQLFCCECFSALPTSSLKGGKFRKTPTGTLQGSMHTKYGYSLLNEVIIFDGCFCCIDSLNFNFPSCIGSYRKSVCCCLEVENICCKMLCCGVEEKRRDDVCCELSRNNVLLVPPYACWKSISQILCLDSRCAIPCDRDVPCVFTPIVFYTCCVEWKIYISFCHTVEDVVCGVRGPTTQQTDSRLQTKIVIINPLTDDDVVVVVDTVSMNKES